MRNHTVERMVTSRPRRHPCQRGLSHAGSGISDLSKGFDQPTWPVTAELHKLADMAHRRPAVVCPGLPRAGTTHAGAKSGTSPAATVVYSTDDGRVIVMALNFGSSRNPAWYYDALKCRCMPTVSAAASSPKKSPAQNATVPSAWSTGLRPLRPLPEVGDMQTHSGDRILTSRLSGLN